MFDLPLPILYHVIARLPVVDYDLCPIPITICRCYILRVCYRIATFTLLFYVTLHSCYVTIYALPHALPRSSVLHVCLLITTVDPLHRLRFAFTLQIVSAAFTPRYIRFYGYTRLPPHRARTTVYLITPAAPRCLPPHHTPFYTLHTFVVPWTSYTLPVCVHLLFVILIYAFHIPAFLGSHTFVVLLRLPTGRTV